MTELYINNQKADLAEDDISLSYNSNLLSDISKIISNNSYTIKLPLSTNNLRLIGCSHIPSAVSKFPYVIHSGTLIKDGMTIVEDADVVMLSVDKNGIDIALTWGNVKNISPLKDLSLRDLRYTADEYLTWAKGENSRLYPRINYGFKEDDTEVWYHPAVSVKWVLDRIGKNANVVFDLPQDREQELNTMFIPLLERNDSQVHSSANAYQLAPVKMVQTNFFKILQFNTLKQGAYYINLLDGHTIKNNNKQKTKVTINGYFAFNVTVNGNFGEPNSKEQKVAIDIRDKFNSATPILASVAADIEHINGKEYRYSFGFKDVTFELEPNSEVSFTLQDYYTIGVDVYHFSVFLFENSIVVSGIYNTIVLGGRYFIIPNLPDLKQIDFLKAIGNMLGLFAVPTARNRIKFISFDKLVERKRDAIDWSKKIVGNNGLPHLTTYSLDDFAQYNTFKYAEVDLLSDYASIRINDTTLEYRKDVVELPFAPTKMINGIAVIPLYTYEDNKLKYSATTDRILKYDGVNGVFTGLGWNNLLSKYYQSYQKLINNAKVITELVELRPLELKSLDLTRPVYLSQYGSYFAIINLKTMDDNICEVKLLKM